MINIECAEASLMCSKVAHRYTKNTVRSAKQNTPQPLSFTNNRSTTYGIVLIGNPHDEDDVESRGCIVKKFRHNCLHS